MIVKNKSELLIDNVFADGDTRQLTIANPPATIDPSAIATYNAAASSILIGDKAGATWVGVNGAALRETTNIDFEIA